MIENPRQSHSIFDMSATLETGKIPDMIEGMIKLFRAQHELNELARVNAPQQSTLSALKNARTDIQQIFSNFVLIPKSSVAGISSFVCRECVKFK